MQAAFEQQRRNYVSPSSQGYASPSGFQSSQTVKDYPGNSSPSDIEILNSELAKILAKDGQSAQNSAPNSPFKQICEQIDQVADRLTFSSSAEVQSTQKEQYVTVGNWPAEVNSTFGERNDPQASTRRGPGAIQPDQLPETPVSQLNTFRQELVDVKEDGFRNSQSQNSEQEEFIDLAQYITKKPRSSQALDSGSEKSDLVAYFAKRAEDDMFLEDCGSSIGRDRLKHMRSPDDVDNRSAKTVDESLFKNLMNQVDDAVESAKKQLKRDHDTLKQVAKLNQPKMQMFRSEKIDKEPAPALESIVIKPKLLPEESLCAAGSKQPTQAAKPHAAHHGEQVKAPDVRPLPPIPKNLHAGSKDNTPMDKQQPRMAVATSNPKVLKLVSKPSTDGVAAPSIEMSLQGSAKRRPSLHRAEDPGQPSAEFREAKHQKLQQSAVGAAIGDQTPSTKKAPGELASAPYLVEMRLAELSTKINYLLKRHSNNTETLLSLVKTVVDDVQADTKVYRLCIKECPGLEDRLETLKKVALEAQKVLKSLCGVIGENDPESQERKEIEAFLLRRIHKQASSVINMIQELQCEIWRTTPGSKVDHLEIPQHNTLKRSGSGESFDQEIQDLVVRKSEQRGLIRVPSVNSRLNFSQDDGRPESSGKENKRPNLPQKTTKEAQTSTFKSPAADWGKSPLMSKQRVSGVGVVEQKATLYQQVLAGDPLSKGQPKYLTPSGPAAEVLSSQKFGCRIFSVLLVQQKLLAAGFEDGGLSIFSICPKEGLALLRSGKLHPRPVTALCSSPSHHKRQLIFAGYAGSTSASVVVWDIHTMKALKELVGHSATISSLQFIEPGYLASTSFDRKVIFWDLEESAAVLAVETLKSPILTSMFDSDSRVLYAGALDGAISALGLVFDDGPAGEIIDCVQLQMLAGQSPVLHLTSYMGDKLLAVQNAKIAIFDSRGIPFREIRTDTLPNSLHIVSEDKGILTDSNGKPYQLDMSELMARGPKTPTELKLGIKPGHSEQTSNLLALRLSGANCQAQFLPPGAFQIHGTLVVSVGEKHDTVFSHTHILPFVSSSVSAPFYRIG